MARLDNAAGLVIVLELKQLRKVVIHLLGGGYIEISDNYCNNQVINNLETFQTVTGEGHLNLLHWGTAVPHFCTCS